MVTQCKLNLTAKFPDFKPQFLAAVDPGLEGGCVFYSLKTNRFLLLEIPFKKVKRLEDAKKTLDCFAFQEALDAFWQVECSETPSVALIIEKPFKRPIESANCFGSSMRLFGELKSFFTLSFPTLYFQEVAPYSWSSYFDACVLLFFEGVEKKSKQDQKKRRAEYLLSLRFKKELFYSKQGRLKDGIVDALALLIWFAEKGKSELFWRSAKH